MNELYRIVTGEGREFYTEGERALQNLVYRGASMNGATLYSGELAIVSCTPQGKLESILD